MEAFAITDIGRRRRMNQDSTHAEPMPIGNLPNLFLVADGMGGHNGGGYASRLAVDTILESVRYDRSGSAEGILTRAINTANRTIFAHASVDEQLKGMGTTVVAATCQDGVLEVANVGDSRLYVIEKDRITQITQDHSLVEEMVRMGTITKEQARNHPDKNIITRAVGVDTDCQADFFAVPLLLDSYVLLCSDGLSNMLEDEEILAVVKGEGTLKEKAQRLIDAANEHGGRDNIAVVLVRPNSSEVSR